MKLYFMGICGTAMGNAALLARAAGHEVLGADENVAFETGLLEKLTAHEQLAVYRHHGFWQCMDTFREMQLLNDMWQEGRAPWRTWH